MIVSLALTGLTQQTSSGPIHDIEHERHRGTTVARQQSPHRLVSLSSCRPHMRVRFGASASQKPDNPNIAVGNYITKARGKSEEHSLLRGVNSN